MNDWQAEIKWDANGLVPVIAQDHQSKQVLMMAWMNKDALALTIAEGQAVYWSRSRQRLWRKGEESGNEQEVQDIRIDCDADVVLLSVIQHGGVACHTGRPHCFYRRWQTDNLGNGTWKTDVDVVKDPQEMYQ